MLRKQPTLVQVDGRSCFKIDEGVIICTEDDLSSNVITDVQLLNREYVNVALVETQGSSTILVSSNYVPKSSDGEACCQAANPYLPMNIAILVLCLDIFLPGIGTIVSAYYDPNGCNCRTVTCGFFQLILTPILVGWIWSII
jgi:hypothetical protein